MTAFTNLGVFGITKTDFNVTLYTHFSNVSGLEKKKNSSMKCNSGVFRSHFGREIRQKSGQKSIRYTNCVTLTLVVLVWLT